MKKEQKGHIFLYIVFDSAHELCTEENVCTD